MTHLILYSTLGCHLCEQAKALCDQTPAASKLQITEVDIADDEELVERYGVRIPVLKDPASEAELGWPFDDHVLIDWLEGLAR